MTKQIWIDGKFFIKRMYKDIFKNSFIIYFFVLIVILVGNWRVNLILYPIGYLGCFGFCFVLCFRKAEKNPDLVEGDR